MKLSFLYGADIGTFSRLLWRQRLRPGLRYIPEVIFHGILALFNTIVGLPEYFRDYKEDPVKPVFILGHWRCGTTHLHNLMTEDGAYHAPSTFDVAFPHAFLFSEKWMAPVLDKINPGKRPQDNMPMTMSSVNEEEVGLASLGAPTPYLVVHFPKDSRRFHSYLSFENAGEEDRERWKKAHKAFLRKLVAKYGNEHPLILKSPANTARIPLLLEMYPDARFIYIHRDPYETIQSSIHLYDTWFRMVSFQSLNELKQSRDEKLLEAYEEIHRRWLEDRHLIPEGKLIMLGFEELRQNPMETVEKIYHFLGDAEPDRPRLKQYLDSIKDYRQNEYEELSPEMVASINRQFGFVFEAFGYPVRESHGKKGKS